MENGNAQVLAAMHITKHEAFRMKEALLRGEMQQMSEVMESAWAAKKRLAQPVSNERIESFYATARAAGARCGKVSGAGGGGFMMFLTDPKRRLNVVRALQALGSEGAVMDCHFSSRGVEAWRVA